MNEQAVNTEVAEMITPFILQNGLELVDVECKREGSSWYLRIFIDKQGGVQLDDCEKVSGYIGTELDESGIIPHQYFLEVSSPGIERPLKKPEDFVRFSGSPIKLRTTTKIEGSRNYQGVISDYVDDMVVLETEGGRSIKIPYHLIKKAKLKSDL
ncbi:MAG: ribosome maturation factor RimP [Syntrophaceticus sp.]|nr:ribosome maturation factor RimP [Syntrophaceticus sp.]MDD3313903.1 ribosome maturation factor RimP [Syntrophaceticus sp.]MDD4358981.1 ribosome maturation factor RimP [Syntrophaceticus sp.]MDD4782207.1 ribosome maturation factor RimP [Syntrophaceticus sp.]